MDHLNVFGAALTPANLQFALTNSGLKWRMHPAQYTSLVYRSLEVFLGQVVASVDSDSFVKALPSYFLYGLPMEIRNDIPEGIVQLILEGTQPYEDAVIFTIEGLAIPHGFYDENLKLKT